MALKHTGTGKYHNFIIVLNDVKQCAFFLNHDREPLTAFLVVVDNIESALSGYFKKEVLGHEDMYKCEKCKQKVGTLREKNWKYKLKF